MLENVKRKDRPHTGQINHPVCQEYGGHLIHGPPSEGNRGRVYISRKEHLNTMTEESESPDCIRCGCWQVREHIPKRPLVSGEPVPAWYIRDKQTAVWLR